jgi:hypothetical protein
MCSTSQYLRNLSIVAYRIDNPSKLMTDCESPLTRCEPQEVTAAVREVGFRRLRVEHPNLSRTPDNLMLIGEMEIHRQANERSIWNQSG